MARACCAAGCVIARVRIGCSTGGFDSSECFCGTGIEPLLKLRSMPAANRAADVAGVSATSANCGNASLNVEIMVTRQLGTTQASTGTGA